MKHTLKITLLLLVLFLASHIVGLYVTNHYLKENSTLPFELQRPAMDEKTSFIPIFITILIATVLALILIKLQAIHIWKLWFFFSVVFCLTISFNAFMPEVFALTLAFILAIFKIFKPNVYLHNFTEVFIYGSLSALFVPVLNILSISILLILISIYDMVAVWKTKHMISMAKFQSDAKMFTGLSIPYGPKKNINKNVITKKTVVREAILGGGDIGFPLLFAGVVLKLYGFFPAVIISITSGLALLILFLMAEKKKFYPAMPFVTIGCFIGYLVVRLFFP